MPLATRVITSKTKNIPAATLKKLHTELATIGLPVVGTEASGKPRFGKATSAQIKAFQQRYKLPATGNLDSATGSILTLSALVATDRDRSKLKVAVQNSLTNVANSPDHSYQLARFAVLAGDYATAQVALQPFPGHVGWDLVIGPIVDPGPRPRNPELPHPENFYSYRRDRYPIDMLNDLQHQIAAVGEPPRDVEQVSPGGLGPDHGSVLIAVAVSWLEALKQWQIGNAEFAHHEYAAAQSAYDACQFAACDYFSKYYQINAGNGSLVDRTKNIVRHLFNNQPMFQALWSKLRWRQSLLSLQELLDWDWPEPPANLFIPRAFDPVPISGLPPLPDYGLGFIQHYLLRGEVVDYHQADRQNDLDAPLFVIAFILAPLARGEVNRARRQYAAGINDFLSVADPLFITKTAGVPPQFVFTTFACDFIERPFARLLAAETLLDQAEAQYKARLSIDDEVDEIQKTAQLTKLGEMVQDFTVRQIHGNADPGAQPFQHLVAALTYTKVISTLQDEGAYVARSTQAVDTLTQSAGLMTAGGGAGSMNFRSLGKTVTIPNVSSVGTTLPGLTAGTHPHEAYLLFDVPGERERNPRVYALLLMAQSRLLQIWRGFNYLGYPDDHVPPWRFHFLLDRARYFSEHAKNAQRDYLNFLANGEGEEFKELSGSQTVELEKSNVQVETSKVDLATAEVAAAQSGADGMALHAKNAGEAANEFFDFALLADEAEAWTDIGSMLVSEIKIGEGIISGDPLSAIGGALGLFGTGHEVEKAHRALEQSNLRRTAAEAAAGALEAQRRLDVAGSSFVVAGLQRQAALMRHEFALQSLQYLRNRTLNSEQWFRMAAAIRSVGDTYLRNAIETAFLVQQSYNFEVDKRLNVIRFDYDLSNVGAMLAADFLLRDLDTLEQDLVASQQTRQQQVRYVLSMAREFPETLRALADSGEVMFSLRLEQLERHFPGLVNLRISSVELQPVALMDPTRVSVELTHLGSGMVRLKAQPGASPLNSSDLAAGADWLPNAAADWPVKIHMSGPETAVFSGLTRQEAASLSAIGANERAAFEGLPGASSWRIDMSMKENQVVPGTLADVLITFTLSGYYDPQLRAAIDGAAPRSLATTSFISARRVLPDAYYGLVHYGKLDWVVSERMLSLAGTPNELRNLAVLLPLVQNGLELGRCYCRYPIRIEVSAGSVDVRTSLPEFTLTPNGLTLNCAFTGPPGIEVTWDFGDGTPLAQGIVIQHTYARPGRYEVLARLARAGRLFEYRGAVVVSANHAVVAPLIVTPTFSAGPVSPDGTIAVTVSVPPGVTDVSIACTAGRVRGWADTGPATLNLEPGSYVLDFLATRKLSARFYSRQRYLPAVPFDLKRDRIATNRSSDPSIGPGTVALPNDLTKHLFGDGSITISPADRWTLELPIAENPFFTSVSPADVAEFDGSELSDAVLSLEFSASQG